MDISEPQRSAQCVLRRLHLDVVARPPPVVVELDSSCEGMPRHGDDVLRIQATKLQPRGQDEHVRREAVAALVGREPELASRDVPGERAVHGGAAERAAPVAAPVAAHENQ